MSATSIHDDCARSSHPEKIGDYRRNNIRLPGYAGSRDFTCHSLRLAPPTDKISLEAALRINEDEAIDGTVFLILQSIRMQRLPLYLATLLLLGISVVTTTAADPEQDSVERDYSKQLPRIKPLEPAAALNSFQLQPGFRIEQAASEPLVVDPIAMAWDENGRLFVIEMRGYSEDDGLVLGRVRLLVDEDEDGRYDNSTVFADGLSWPTAITCSQGGIYVGAAPDIFFLKDTDGDGKADQKKRIFSGFGKGNVQGLMNTFKWGFDNRIHGATSSSGAAVTGNPSSKSPLSLRGRDFSFSPGTHDIRPTSGGGQHGLSFNRWGEKFVCSNSNHIQQVMFDDRYLARNPYLATPGSRRTIAADGPQADVFRASPIEPWRIVRTRLRVKKLVPGPVEGGGTPAGYFTGATGVTMYRGNAWPAQFLDWAIIGDVGSNLVHRKRLKSQGIHYVAQRVDEKSEFLTSTDIWFRPVQFANAPDGALYIADMYREVIEHPKSLPPVIKKHLDLTSGRDRGRIYRIVGKDFKQPALPKLGDASSKTLVATLDHPNGWHRETAARLIYERQDAAAIPALIPLVTKAKLPEGRIRALHALSGLQGLTAETILSALDDEHPWVRVHAIRLAEDILADSLVTRNRLISMVDDDDIHVRYQLAFTLGAMRGGPRNRALAQLAQRDANNDYMQIALQSSLTEGAGEVLALLTDDAEFCRSASGIRFVKSLAKQIGKQQRSADIATLLQLLPKLAREKSETMPTIVAGLELPNGSSLSKSISAATGGKAEQITAQLLAQAAQVMRDAQAPLDKKVAAAQSLRLGNFTDQGAALVQQLHPSAPLSLQTAALDTLAQFPDPAVANAVISRWSILSPRVRGRATDVLASRTVWLNPLLTAVESGDIPLADLETGQLRLLASHADKTIQQRAQALLGKTSVRARADVVATYQPALDLQGDVQRGAAVFKKVCSTCHALGGVGHPIGPNLAAMRNRGPEAILLNVLDPNREVNPKYLSYSLLTADGRTLAGMIEEETATSITLRRADNAKHTILRIDIDELRSSGISLMPEGLEKQINQQQMADLLQFLQRVD